MLVPLIGAAAKAALIAGKPILRGGNPGGWQAERRSDALQPSSGAVMAHRRGADAGVVPRQALAMLDAPFYSRSAVRTVFGGEVGGCMRLWSLTGSGRGG